MLYLLKSVFGFAPWPSKSEHLVMCWTYVVKLYCKRVLHGKQKTCYFKAIRLYLQYFALGNKSQMRSAKLLFWGSWMHRRRRLRCVQWCRITDNSLIVTNWKSPIFSLRKSARCTDILPLVVNFWVMKIIFFYLLSRSHPCPGSFPFPRWMANNYKHNKQFTLPSIPWP